MKMMGPYFARHLIFLIFTNDRKKIILAIVNWYSLNLTAACKDYKNILVSTKGKVGIVQLNRPKALNALNTPLMLELNEALQDFDSNNDIGAMVVTGSEKAFAAGADIKEMKDLNFVDNYKKNFLGDWTGIVQIRKPIIAAVNGFALGFFFP